MNNQKGKRKNINRQFNEDYTGILDKVSILIEHKTMQFEINFHVHLSADIVCCPFSHEEVVARVGFSYGLIVGVACCLFVLIGSLMA